MSTSTPEYDCGTPARPRRKCALPVAALALLTLAGSAHAADLWVATRNPATGQFTVRDSVLNPKFPDGTPVEQFAIRSISNGFLLVRSASTTPGSTCRTQATPVYLADNRAWVKVDEQIHVQLLCAPDIYQECDSCKLITDAIGGPICGCYQDGAYTGLRCESDWLWMPWDHFILEWLGPLPDPPDPRR